MSLALACVFAGCSTHHARAPAAAAITPASSSYIDLEPGWRLRVVTPILKSGGYRLGAADLQVSGDTVTLSAGPDFLGYELAYYAVKARGVEFLSAQITRDGQTAPQPRPVARLFQLPRGVRHVRLIYLIRVSQADHDMAVAAAKDMNALDALTRRVMANPADGCKTERGAVCSWIPAGIAATPEVRVMVGGAEHWVPAR